MPNPALLDRVEAMMMADDGFANEFEKFAKDNCNIFEDTEENKLQYTVLYEQFTRLFNERVEAFISKSGATLEEFVDACQHAGDDVFVVQMILSITSFDEFKNMMIYEKRKLQ